jgi:hypothetical protein
VGFERFKDGSMRRWCRFNVSVLAQEGRRQDKALSEDKAEAVSSSWLNEKEV